MNYERNLTYDTFLYVLIYLNVDLSSSHWYNLIRLKVINYTRKYRFCYFLYGYLFKTRKLRKNLSYYLSINIALRSSILPVNIKLSLGISEFNILLSLTSIIPWHKIKFISSFRENKRNKRRLKNKNWESKCA